MNHDAALRSIAHDVAAAFIAERRPDESILFEAIWHQLVSGHAFDRGPATAETVRAFGLRSDSESQGVFTAPFAILIVWSVLIEMKTRNMVPDGALIEPAIRKCATALGAPADLIDEIADSCVTKLLAILNDPERAIFSRREAEASAHPFKSMPHIDLAGSQIRDGRDGDVVRAHVFRGAERAVLRKLLAHEPIHVVEILTLQAASSTGTVFERRKHAESTIAKVRRALKAIPLTIVKREGNRRGLEWVLDESRIKTFSSSFGDAIETVQRGDAALRDGNAPNAVAIAKRAISCDPGAQQAHELLCRAAIADTSNPGGEPQSLSRSLRFIRKRVEQLERGETICRNSYESAEDCETRKSLERYEVGFTAERVRLEYLVSNMVTRFGPLEEESPKDRDAKEAIRELRARNIGPDAAMSNPISKTILDHPAVEALRSIAFKEAKAESPAKRARLSELISQQVLLLATDPRKTENIRAICSGVKFRIWDLVNPTSAGSARTGEDSEMTRFRDARDAIFKQRGRKPSLEVDSEAQELSNLSGLSLERMREIRDRLDGKPKTQRGDDESEHGKTSNRLNDEDEDDFFEDLDDDEHIFDDPPDDE